MSGDGACASTTYRGFLLRKYFRDYNRMGAGWYLLPQLSHHCNFEGDGARESQDGGSGSYGSQSHPIQTGDPACSHAGSNAERVLREQARDRRGA